MPDDDDDIEAVIRLICIAEVKPAVNKKALLIEGYSNLLQDIY